MIQFFSGIEVVPTGVYMALNANGGPSGDAYVQFSRQCDAILAQRRQRHCMGRRYIEIFACQQSDVVAAMHMNTQSSQAAAAETFSVSEAQKSIRRDDWRYQGVVRMRGLPYDTTTSDIAQFFAGLPIAPEGVHLCCTTDKNPSASTDDCAMQSTSAANTTARAGAAAAGHGAAAREGGAQLVQLQSHLRRLLTPPAAADGGVAMTLTPPSAAAAVTSSVNPPLFLVEISSATIRYPHADRHVSRVRHSWNSQLSNAPAQLWSAICMLLAIGTSSCSGAPKGNYGIRSTARHAFGRTAPPGASVPIIPQRLCIPQGCTTQAVRRPKARHRFFLFRLPRCL